MICGQETEELRRSTWEERGMWERVASKSQKEKEAGREWILYIVQKGAMTQAKWSCDWPLHVAAQRASMAQTTYRHEHAPLLLEISSQIHKPVLTPDHECAPKADICPFPYEPLESKAISRSPLCPEVISHHKPLPVTSPSPSHT